MTSDVVNTSMGYSNAAFKYSWLLAMHAIRVVLSCLELMPYLDVLRQKQDY